MPHVTVLEKLLSVVGGDDEQEFVGFGHLSLQLRDEIGEKGVEVAKRLVEHGFPGDRDAIWSMLEVDIVLNAQGLVAWLERLERQNG